VTRPSPLRVAAYLVGVAGLAFCITLLCAALRRRGDITNAECETAKATTLAEAGRETRA
jgi:hypothetical protein